MLHLQLEFTQLEYALEVERLTTRKRNNLILNVDGCIGVLCCDLLREIGFIQQQVRQFIDREALNAGCEVFT